MKKEGPFHKMLERTISAFKLNKNTVDAGVESEILNILNNPELGFLHQVNELLLALLDLKLWRSSSELSGPLPAQIRISISIKYTIGGSALIMKEARTASCIFFFFIARISAFRILLSFIGFTHGSIWWVYLEKGYLKDSTHRGFA